MNRFILLAIVSVIQLSISFSQSYNWSTTKEGIFRDGEPFYLNGQSWAKKTVFTYNQGESAEAQVKSVLTRLHNIGVNAIRIYGSPDDSDWDGSSNFDNLIKWIEEWNAENPDGGDPNKAMYYIVQLSPEDPQSSLSGNLPENSTASFNRAISDNSNDASVKKMIEAIDDITGGSKYLLAYLIYHELNISSKYSEWYSSIGASGIESFMNEVADAIHSDYAPGKLVSHTGDSKNVSTDIYKAIEGLDETEGNVFANFDMIGFNLYISTDGLLSENEYYQRIVNRRKLSVNDSRGWFIGETGASYDKEADPGSVAAANYTNPQGAANLQHMWDKSKALGNMIGFVLFTVQDNDLGETIGDQMKQRGFFDAYNSRKFLYYIYSDVIEEISTNERLHVTHDHVIGVKIIEETDEYNIIFEFENKTGEEKEFYFTVHSDDGSSKQRYSVLEEETFLTLQENTDTIITKSYLKPSGNSLLAVTSNVIANNLPFNSYLWGREYILSDAISTVAGLNINVDNLPDGEITSLNSIQETTDKNFQFGKFLFNTNARLDVPEGNWELSIYDLSGVLLYQERDLSSERIELNKMQLKSSGIGIYRLTQF